MYTCNKIKTYILSKPAIGKFRLLYSLYTYISKEKKKGRFHHVYPVNAIHSQGTNANLCAIARTRTYTKEAYEVLTKNTKIITSTEKGKKKH